MDAESLKLLRPAVERLQTLLRLYGLQHLAALLNVGEIATEADLLNIQSRVRVVQRLLELRPPASKTRGTLKPAFDVVTALLKKSARK